MLSKAVVWTSSENEPVLGLLLSVLVNPSLWLPEVWVWIGFWVVKSWVESWNNHGTLWNGVVFSDWEILLNFVWNHQDWWAVSESLLNHGTGVGHVVQKIHSCWLEDIPITDGELFSAELGEDFWSVSEKLEQPGSGTRGSVLRSEQESKQSLADLLVGEIPYYGWCTWSFSVNLTGFDTTFPFLGGNHRLDPMIEDASWFSGCIGHGVLGLLSTDFESVKNKIGRLLAIPGTSEWDDDWEVDKVQSSSDVDVVLGDDGNGLSGDVVSAESLARKSNVDVTELRHEWLWLSIDVLAQLNPSLEVSVIDLLLTWEVRLHSSASEQSVETLAEIRVTLSIEEDKVGGAKKLDRNVDDTRTDIAGGVHALSSQIAGRGDDNEPKTSYVSKISNEATLYPIHIPSNPAYFRINPSQR